MLLSIVIPTKNRPATLYHAIRAALALPSSDVEVVVQDCSNDDKAQHVVASLAADVRLSYARSPGAPSMTENWNAAFERVRGEYVVVLGDDDAVGKEMVNAARWATENDVDAITDERVTYFWPNYQLQEVAGTVRVTRHTGEITYHDALHVLEKTLRKYPVNPQPLPHIYNGLVRTRLMHQIKERTGRFFHSMAPDYYSTVALSCIVRRFARAAYPLCVSGASAAANAGRMHDGTDYLHALEYKQQSQWSPYVPPFYSMTTTIFDATIKALTDVGRPDLIPSLDYSSFYADCLAQQPGKLPAIAKEVRRLLRDHPSLARVVAARLVPRSIQMTGRRLRQRAGRPSAARGLKKLKSRLSRVDYDVLPASDIVEALDRLQHLLHSRGVTSPFAPGPPPPAVARLV